MFNPKIEEDYGFGRTYNIFENAKIMYYIVETYGETIVGDMVDQIIKKTGTKTEPERREAEVQVYTEFLRQMYPLFKPARDDRLIRVLLAIVDLQTAQEALLDNHETLKGKKAFDSLILTSHIFDGGKVASICSNRALDRMAFETKTHENQNDLLGFEDETHYVLTHLHHMSEDLKTAARMPDMTRKVRGVCRDNMLRLNRAMSWLRNVYFNIDDELAA